MKTIIADSNRGIFIGTQGEDRALKVLFPVVEAWAALHGPGVFYLLFMRQGDTEPYICETEVTGANVEWIVRNTDLAEPGVGRAELQYYTAAGLVKSETYVTRSVASIAGGGDPPEPWSAWVENVLEAGQRAEDLAEDLTETLENIRHIEETEQDRDTAEGERTTAEQARADAEDGRAVAETARDLAEQARDSAETARDTAEQARDSAESDRAAAEVLRSAAEEARVAAEEERRTHIPPLSEKALVAEQLENVSDESGTYQTAPFVFQGTGTDNNTTETPTAPVAKHLELRGNTVVWNQLNNNAQESSSFNGITYTKKSDGSWEVSGTAIGNSNKSVNTQQIKLEARHRYLLRGRPTGGDADAYTLSVYASVGGNNTYVKDRGEGVIFDTTGETLTYCGIGVEDGTSFETPVLFYPQVFDLTRIYGEGNEPSTIEQFNRDYPLPYYDYNAGELKSCKSNKLVTVDYNQFQAQDQFIKVIAGQTYRAAYWNGTVLAPLTSGSISEYDGARNLIQTTTYDNLVSLHTLDSDYPDNSDVGLTLTDNTHYVKITGSSNTNILFNIAWDGSRTGYKESIKHEYNLPNIELASISAKSNTNVLSSVYDIILPDGSYTRKIGVVDMGDLTWTLSPGADHVFETDIAYTPDPQVWIDLPKTYAYGNSVYITCPDYNTVFGTYAANLQDMQLSALSALRIRDNRYSTPQDFTEAVSGKLLYYAIKTPVEDRVSSFAENVEVDDFGTMEFVSSETERATNPIIPQGNKFFYPADYALLVDDLNKYTNGEVKNLAKKEDLPPNISSTNPKDRGITEESTDVEILAEWQDGEDRFTLIRRQGAGASGTNNLVLARNGHAFGNGNYIAPEANSGFAAGTGCYVFYKYGIAGGLQTIVRNKAETAFGKFNTDDPRNTERLFSIGNGESEENTHDCFEAGGSIGNEYFKVGDERMTVYELNELLDFLGGQRCAFTSNNDGTCSVSIGNNTRKKIVIPSVSPEGDTVTAIAQNGFENSDMESIVLPRTITSIGIGAFSGCQNLRAVYIKTYPNIPNVGTRAFPEECEIVVSSENLAEVQNAWDEYAGQVCTEVIYIKTATDLRSVATKCNSGEKAYSGAAVVLDADLDLSGSTWTSIGNSTYPFKGSFNGNGHTIGGMTRSGGVIGQNVGLFGVVSAPDGVTTNIQNFKLTGSIVSNKGGENAGTVISAVKPSTTGTVKVNITGIWSTVNFDAASAKMTCVGGILGTIAWCTDALQTTINIDSCRYSGTLDSPSAGSNDYGGIMGYPKEACGPREINITNCVFDGVMILRATSPDDNGGIMGYFKGNGSIGAQTDIHVTNCLVAGQFQHTNKSDQTNTGYVVSEKSGDNTDYSVTNVYYCNDSDRHTGGAMGGWYGYMKGSDTDPVGIAKINVTAKTMTELVAMTSGFEDDSKWHFYNDGSNLPVPAAVFGLL